jgi:hypothetical protein
MPNAPAAKVGKSQAVKPAAKKAAKKVAIKKIEALFKKEMARPTASDLYYWCDYIELKCLVDPDHKYSRGRVLELLDDSAQLYGDVTDADNNAQAKDEVILGGDDEEELDEEAFLPIGGLVSSTPPSLQKESRVAGWFANFEYRAAIFGDNYPFELSADSQELSLRDITPKGRQLYLQLLLSSSLRLIPATRWDELTEPFEEISEQIFAKLMPSGWKVHRFGAKGATRYKGLLFSKLQKLAKDLRAPLQLKKEHFKTGNSGDGGLDLVAWHPLGDARIGIPIALAQCGCTAEEWSKKSLEAAPDALWSHMPAHHRWATYYFMPHDLVVSSGSKQDWQRRPKITACIVIDRLRLMNLAGEYNIIDSCASTPQLITEATGLAL